METIIIKSDSIYFPEVIKLWRINSSTLGLFPEGAFRDAASKNFIIGAIDSENKLLGYILYRISRHRAFIVHLCIHDLAKRKGVAKFLVDELKTRTSACFGIGLKCRKDYEANSVWPKFNFQAINEAPGRSKEGHLLVSWWFSHNHDDLFSELKKEIAQNKFLTCIDANVFFDLKDNRNEESAALMNDWLTDEIELCLTPEIYNEIIRSQDENQRVESRKYVKKFTLLSFNENDFKVILIKLKKQFPPITQRDKSDLMQVAQSISGGAEFFITRDENVLKKSDFIEKEYHLLIKRPSDLILHFDELIRSSIYQPQSLSGTIYESRLPSGDQIDSLANEFLNHKKDEKVIELKKLLRNIFSNPRIFTPKLIYDQNKKIIGCVIFDHSKANEVSIPFFRVKTNALKKTFVKHLALIAILKTLKEDRKILIVNDLYIDDETTAILCESNFLKINSILYKIILNGMCNLNELGKSLNELLKDKGDVKLEFNKLVEEATKSSDVKLICFCERFFWPIKLVENTIPTFIIPIKPKYAAELFDEGLLNERLWGSERELVLNRENVYYRSKRPAILNGPARILWYVSTDDHADKKSGRMQIKACSYLDEVFIDKPKVLYSKFKKLGIYEWEHIYNLAKKHIENEIMAFTFSDTELFQNPITFTRLSRLYEETEKKNLAIQSPVLISNKLFHELYETGTAL